MPGLHTEGLLHKEILNELQSRGWLIGDGSKAAGKYDAKRALYTEDAITWLSTDKPDEFAKVKAMHNGGAESNLLDRLVKILEQRGSIYVLRNGFSHVNAKFEMCAFAPNSGMNPKEAERAKRVILRVVPELRYSESNDNRLVLMAA